VKIEEVKVRVGVELVTYGCVQGSLASLLSCNMLILNVRRLLMSAFSGPRLLSVEVHRCIFITPLTFLSPKMFFTKASLIFVVVTLAAVFCAQSVEAARGPKITNKVYFDIKHGDQDMGRSAFTPLSCRLLISIKDLDSRAGPFRWRTSRWVNPC
jgi:hypothetical protein